MIRPTPRFALWMGAGLVAALVPAAWGGQTWWVWWVFIVSLVVVGVVDGLRLARVRQLELEVSSPTTLGMGSTAPLEVDIAVPSSQRPTRIDMLFDMNDLIAPVAGAALDVPAGGAGRHVFPLRPVRRGTGQVRTLWLRWRGPLGLVERLWVVGLDRSIAIQPNIAAVRAFALRFFGASRNSAGIKAERFLGDGSEFESLRKYVPGLDTRSIDWRASARHTRLLSRHFRAERNHQVIVAIDSGHQMGEALEGTPRLDHAINSGLLLSYLCLRTGDRVGLYDFAARPGKYLAPQNGLAAFTRISQASAAIEYGTDETNFTLGMLDLSARLRRRSLIIVFTHFTDSITARLMLDNMSRLSRRHVVLFVDLADPALEQFELDVPRRLTDVGRAVVAGDLRRDRREVHDRMRRDGIHVLGARPRQLDMDLVNRYLDIKRRELV